MILKVSQNQVHTLFSLFFFFKNFSSFRIYVFIIFVCAGSSLLHGLFFSCGEWRLLSDCSAQASHCGDFSCCSAWTLGYGLQYLRLLGSRAQAQ